MGLEITFLWVCFQYQFGFAEKRSDIRIRHEHAREGMGNACENSEGGDPAKEGEAPSLSPDSGYWGMEEEKEGDESGSIERSWSGLWHVFEPSCLFQNSWNRLKGTNIRTCHWVGLGSKLPTLWPDHLAQLLSSHSEFMCRQFWSVRLHHHIPALLNSVILKISLFSTFILQ